MPADPLHGNRIGVVQMIVHPHQAGNHRVAGTVHRLRALRNLHRSGRANRLNLAVGNHHRPVFRGGGAGPIDHPHMIQDEYRRVDTHKFRCVVRLRRLRESCRGNQQSCNQKEQSHSYTSEMGWMIG